MKIFGSYQNISRAILFIGIILLSFMSCQKEKTINIGYIGPLSTRATDLGIAPSKAMKLAVAEYNENRKNNEPKINLIIEDDKWEEKEAIPAYERLRKQDVKVVFISNTDGTIAISKRIKNDGVILVNPTNNDAILDELNHNVFRIAKSTEETHSLVAQRIINLGLKNVLIIHYPNDFMTLGAKVCSELLDEAGIKNKVICYEPGKIDFLEDFKAFKKENYDSYLFFGYKEYGYAMKQARDLGIKAKFFGSTVLLDKNFYKNSEGAIIGTEFLFFTPEDGNYFLANKFLDKYEKSFGEKPFSVWPAMQAYDAMNIVISKLRKINEKEDLKFDDWLREQLYKTRYYEGVCGNISISYQGNSKGIYFSLFEYISEGKYSKVNN